MKGFCKEINQVKSDSENAYELISGAHQLEAQTIDKAKEVSRIVKNIDLISQSLEDTNHHVEDFIKSLYINLSSLVTYEGTFIHQNQFLIKSQCKFIKDLNVENIVTQQSDELNMNDNIMPDGIEELDLIIADEEKNDIDDLRRHHIEGSHNIPYKSKE